MSLAIVNLDSVDLATVRRWIHYTRKRWGWGVKTSQRKHRYILQVLKLSDLCGFYQSTVLVIIHDYNRIVVVWLEMGRYRIWKYWYIALKSIDTLRYTKQRIAIHDTSIHQKLHRYLYHSLVYCNTTIHRCIIPSLCVIYSTSKWLSSKEKLSLSKHNN